jgi:hypothetical protein
MRIISRWSDYYDGVMKTGMDPNVVYVRDEKDVSIKDDFQVYRNGSTGYSYSLRYIGFCGYIHRLMTITNPYENFSQYYYDFAEFKKDALKFRAASEWDFGRSKWYGGRISKFLEEDTAKMQEIFHKYQVPVFMITTSPDRHKQTLILNPCLKNFRFQTVKDSYTAYQDIFQFVSGILNSPEHKMVQISDKDKVSKHGFDKWSFRQKGPKK